MQAISYIQISKKLLPKIKPLWEALNLLHFNDSLHFKEHYATFTFEARISRWEEMTEDKLFMLIAETDHGQAVGYCVSTMDENMRGEIDSLFVLADFRGQRIGKELMERSMKWLQDNRCKQIHLSVSCGHEEVLDFYQKIGFFPRMTVFEFKII